MTAAEGELRQARTFPHNPRLEWEGLTGHDRNEVRRGARKFTAKLSQELPLGGKWRQRIQVAAAGRDRTQWEVHNVQRELIKEVKETFYRLLFLEEKRAFAEQAVALAQRLAEAFGRRYGIDNPSVKPGPVVLPAVALSVALVSLLFGSASNILSRQVEARAWKAEAAEFGLSTVAWLDAA